MLNRLHFRRLTSRDHSIRQPIQRGHLRLQSLAGVFGVREFVEQREGFLLVLRRPRLLQQRVEQLAGIVGSIGLRSLLPLRMQEGDQRGGIVLPIEDLHENLAELVFHLGVGFSRPAFVQTVADLLPVSRRRRRNPLEIVLDSSGRELVDAGGQIRQQRLADARKFVALLELSRPQDRVSERQGGVLVREIQGSVGQRFPPARFDAVGVEIVALTERMGDGSLCSGERSGGQFAWLLTFTQPRG